MSENKKKAIVVSLNDDVSEIVQLADSFEYEIIKTYIQHRKTPDVNSFIGPGKVDEVKDFIENFDSGTIDLIIINSELKPSQWFTLEKKLNIDVYDRVRLILAIFEERADRKEAKLQVRLAQLNYERPFVRELIHRARAGEHPGFMAGGEYQVDDYYEVIKKQMKKIRGNLKKIRDEREVRRQHRHISGFYLVSLAGYTNAGKSSLLNLLSGEKVKVEGRLFSTLSTTTRRINDNNYPILLTDTVGFIQNLPAWIIDAFHSTLEEIEAADIVLLVVYASEKDETIAMKLEISLEEIIEMGVESPIIIVFNKIDLISKDVIDTKIDYLGNIGLLKNREIIPISVKNKENLNALMECIYKLLPNIVSIKLKLPINEKTQSFISWVYKKAYVSSISYSDYVTICIECNSKIKGKILFRCKDLNGFVI